jgi:hypothetical protein
MTPTVAVLPPPVIGAESAAVCTDSQQHHHHNEEEQDCEEAEDSFPQDGVGGSTNSIVLIDPESLAMMSQRSRRPPAGPASIATTALASAVGSVVGPPQDAFLKSFTFLKDRPCMDWGISFGHVDANNPGAHRRGGGLLSKAKRHNKSNLFVDTVQGSVALSPIKEGDFLKSINGVKCGPSYNSERALVTMNQSLETEGVLSVAVDNPNGSDILVQATILKPRPNMTYEELGIVVWFWGFLCIKEFDKNSIFKHTVLKEADQIISINDIACDVLKPEQFAEIIGALPLEVTITVMRRKQRVSGMFG